MTPNIRIRLALKELREAFAAVNMDVGVKVMDFDDGRRLGKILDEEIEPIRMRSGGEVRAFVTRAEGVGITFGTHTKAEREANRREDEARRAAEREACPPLVPA